MDVEGLYAIPVGPSTTGSTIKPISRLMFRKPAVGANLGG